MNTSAITGTITHNDGIRFEVPFLIVTCIIGYVGNFLVLIVYSRKKYRRSNAALYILNLAVGDTVTMTVVCFHVTEFYRVTWPLLWRSDIQCAIHRAVRFLGFDITVFTMTAIAVDRYFAVCHPIAFRTKFTPRRTKLVIAMLWVLAVMTASPALAIFKAIYGTEDQGIAYQGKLPWACKLVMPRIPALFHFKAIYINVILFFIPTIITSCIYVVIVFHVWQARTAIRRSRNGQTINCKTTHWKTARILLVVFFAYVITHGFFATYNILFQFKITENVPPVVNNIGLLLPYANSFMNPIIYSLMHASFRKSCLEVIKGKFNSHDLNKGHHSSAFELRGSVEQLSAEGRDYINQQYNKTNQRNCLESIKGCLDWLPWCRHPTIQRAASENTIAEIQSIL
ncbi:QRFP-like peptide receptor [Amphiura filiformis]|uniref:QRFP-like peptide receptor n=1 Tax=Amphiura filiformis TaxID=82378 RepID=UPI003B218466